MPSIADLLTRLTGQPPPPSRAPHPVWRGSVMDTPPLAARDRLTKKEAAKLYHLARDLERRTRQPGRQDGTLGRNGLKILEALLFDFRNHVSGRCDPAIASIARAAALSARSVARGLVKLREAGVVSWIRRCDRTIRDGRVHLRQRSNSYTVHPVTRWRSYVPVPPPPKPHPTTWGATPPLPTPLAVAADLSRAGAAPKDVVRALEDGPGDPIGMALAKLGRHFHGPQKPGNTGLPG